MINKKISTIAGSLIIIAIVVTLGFVFFSGKEKEIQNQNNVVSDNSDLGSGEIAKQEKEIAVDNNQVPEEKEDNEMTSTIDVSDWKNYSNKKISFSYPNNYELKTGSDNPSEREPNMYSFDNISGKKNEWLFFLYKNLSEKYVEERIGAPTTTKIKEFQLPSGEKIIILNIQDKTTKESKFLSFVSKEKLATSLEVYGPLIVASSQEIATYEEFLKGIRIK